VIGVSIRIISSPELLNYFRRRMLGYVVAHMIVKSDTDIDKLLNSLVEYFYRIYGRRYSLSKEVFKEIADLIKQYLSNY
jgi:hypothetical protein